jgi:hypothetical protein
MHLMRLGWLSGGSSVRRRTLGCAARWEFAVSAFAAVLPRGAAGGWRLRELAQLQAFYRYVLIDFKQTVSEGGTTMAGTGAVGSCSTLGRA